MKNNFGDVIEFYFVFGYFLYQSIELKKLSPLSATFFFYFGLNVRQIFVSIIVPYHTVKKINLGYVFLIKKCSVLFNILHYMYMYHIYVYVYMSQ